MLPMTSVPSSLSTVGLLALSTTDRTTAVVTVGESLGEGGDGGGGGEGVDAGEAGHRLLPEVYPAGVAAPVPPPHIVHPQLGRAHLRRELWRYIDTLSSAS